MKALINVSWGYYLELPELPAKSLLAIMTASKIYKQSYDSKVYTLCTENVKNYTGSSVVKLVLENALVSPNAPELTMEFLAEENNRLSRLLTQAEANLSRARTSEATSKELVVE